MNIPCCDFSPCEDSPVPTTGYSADDPDLNLAIGYSFGIPGKVPALNSRFVEQGCVVTCEAETQQEADNCASVNWNECVASASQNNPTRIRWPKANTDNQPPDIFFNSEYDFSGTCSDGTPFIFSVPAATFSAFTQAEADAIAQSYAQTESGKLGCLGDLPVEICFGVFTSLQLTANGVGPFDFSVVSGSLPTGMVGQQTSPNTFSITGFPSAFGTFTFTVQLTNPDAITTNNTYTINVVGPVTNPNLPNATAGIPYMLNLISGGLTTGAVVWSLVAGNLPPGMALSPSGSLSGTPTTPGQYAFVVEMQDSATSCQMACALTVGPPGVPCSTTLNGNWSSTGLYTPQTLLPTSISFHFAEQSFASLPINQGVTVQKSITNSTGQDFTLNVAISWNMSEPSPPYNGDIIGNGNFTVFFNGATNLNEVFHPANLSGNASTSIVVPAGQTVTVKVTVFGIEGLNSGTYDIGAMTGTVNLSCQ